jgi:hypothetical protein
MDATTQVSGRNLGCSIFFYFYEKTNNHYIIPVPPDYPYWNFLLPASDDTVTG